MKLKCRLLLPVVAIFLIGPITVLLKVACHVVLLSENVSHNIIVSV